MCVLVPVAKKTAARAGHVARSGGTQICRQSTQAAVVGGADRDAFVVIAVGSGYDRARGAQLLLSLKFALPSELLTLTFRRTAISKTYICSKWTVR